MKLLRLIIAVSVISAPASAQLLDAPGPEYRERAGALPETRVEIHVQSESRVELSLGTDFSNMLTEPRQTEDDLSEKAELILDARSVTDY